VIKIFEIPEDSKETEIRNEVFLTGLADSDGHLPITKVLTQKKLFQNIQLFTSMFRFDGEFIISVQSKKHDNGESLECVIENPISVK
jgi:hypothetical protein